MFRGRVVKEAQGDWSRRGPKRDTYLFLLRSYLPAICCLLHARTSFRIMKTQDITMMLGSFSD